MYKRQAAPGARDFYLQGLRYLERPRTEANLLDAERLFERSLREDPDLAVAWAGLAETWWARHMETHEERWKDKAEEAALRAHTIDPSSAAVLTAMGTTQRHTGRTELAEASFREALEQDPSWVPARIGHALSLESAGRYEEAEAELERCVRQRSDWAETHAVLGRFCLRRGRMAEAIAHIFDAVDRAPDDSRSYSDLGAALQYEGRIGEAIEAYRAAQAIRPNYAALCNLASLYRDTDRPEEAVEVLEEALRLQDHDFLVWKALALTLLVLGRDPERTRHAFLRSIELAEAAAAENPRDAVVLAQLAELYLEVGDRTAARLRIQRALSLGGGWVDVEVSAASVCWETGDREGCLAHMEAALKLGFRASALRRDRAFRECVQSEGVAALLRRYEPSVESDREKEDVMGTEPFGKGGCLLYTSPSPRDSA
ncbi:MAG: tetratricopeptide repeat protein, partial [Candidatus Eisenbacteria bacterium]|nr:tetratricopeptide repeat protein [Candidatus Eisenbacteria bacterium]